MTIQLTPLQQIIVQAIILAIVLTAPLLFAESGTGIEQLPADLQKPGSERINANALAKLKAAHPGGFTQGKWLSQAPDGKTYHSDIYQNSIILQHGDTHTVLPLHAVIYLPECHKTKVVTRAKGDFVPWPQFYVNNRSWLFTHQINLKQAMGTASIGQDVLKQFKKINRIVVAIHQNNPISALPVTNKRVATQ
jgi:hypothetical protein